MSQLADTNNTKSSRSTAARSAFTGLLLLNAAAMVTSFAVDGITPSWVVYPILLLVGLAVSKRNLRTGGIVMLASAGLFLLMHLQFVSQATAGDECVHPADDDRACHPATWIATLGAVPAITVAGAAFVIATAQARRVHT